MRIKFFISSFLLVIVFASCTPEVSIDNPPAVQTDLIITQITATTASVGAKIVETKNPVLSKGVCWSTKVAPTIEDSLTVNGAGSGEFVSKLKNLIPNTFYFVRAYATDKNGTVYGDAVGFLSKRLATTLTINNISGVTDVEAVVSGNIVSDGGEVVTERGICYGKFPHPTIDSMKVSNEQGTGTFSCNLTNLILNTKYYFRAYAITGAGISYGSELNFTTLDYPKTVTDIDGNIYHTIKIGTQVWLVENLKTTKFNDGTSIANVTDYSWSTISTPAYCWYNNNLLYKADYGALYNWYAASSTKIAPVGWHVPTQAEFQQLVTYLGGSTIAGAKLKETGNTHWNSNSGATNSSGFTAVPGGYSAYSSGNFHSLGDLSVYWSSTQSSAQSGSQGTRLLMDWSSKADLDFDYRNEGFSIRCIRN